MQRLALWAALALLAVPSAQAGTSLTVKEGTNFAVDISPDGKTLVLDLQGRLWKLPAAGGSARAITDEFGDNRVPRFSPDGRWLAFQTFRRGSWDIWLARADGSEPRPLTSDEGDEREPVWSADGRRVFYAADHAGNYDIWSSALDGGEPERLTTESSDDYAPAVARDGTLAFVSDRGGKPAFWLAAAGAEPRKLAGGTTARLAAPAFSADGRTLAFVAPTEEIGFPSMARQRLFVVDVAGGEPRPISAAGEDVFPFAPAWSGTSLVYSSDGRIRVRAVDAAASEPREIAFEASFEIENAGLLPKVPVERRGRQRVRGIVEPVTAADGSIVFVALGDLWRRHADGKTERLTQNAFVERDPAVSSDGKLLAFISDRSGGMQVWERELATGAERVLTNVSGGVRYPTYSPDGKRLAFQRPGPRGDQDFTLHVLERDGGAVRKLDAPPLWPGRMSFSGDGKRLLVAVLTASSKRAREGVNRVVLVDLAGGYRDAGLPAELRIDAGPVVSPDGSRLALLVDGAPWLVSLAADGTPSEAPRELRAELADYPSWSADTRQLNYVGLDGLVQLDVATGASRKLPLDLDWRAADGDTTLIHASRLFDGRGDSYRSDVDIVVKNGRIHSVNAHREHRSYGRGVREIDATGLSVIPGLIENHGHHQGHDGEWVGRAWLSFGVTSVVEPGGLPYESREFAESWDSGARPGPRLFFAGPQLDGQRRYFPFASHVTTERRLSWELERARKLDYALLKTYTRMPPARQAEAIAAASRLGVIASSHEIYPALAVRGGRVEHLRGTTRTGFSAKQTDLLRSYSDAIGIVATPRAVISPTIVVSGGFFDYWLRHPELAANAQFRTFYPESYRNGLQGLAQVVGRRAALLGEGAANARAAVGALHRSGARIVAGTDSPIFPYGLALVVELANYVEAGLTPAEALRTATSAAADALGVGRELGRIEPGRLADLVIVEGDPLQDVTALLAVRGVMRGGVYRPLDELLGDRVP